MKRTDRPDRSSYGKPLDKASPQYAVLINKTRFTLFEFACLQAGIDPASFDGSLLSEEVKESKIGPYVRELLAAVEKDESYDDCPF